MARRALTETDLGIKLDALPDPRSVSPANVDDDPSSDRPEGGVWYGKYHTQAVLLVGCVAWGNPSGAQVMPPDEAGRCPVCGSPRKMTGSTVCLNCHQSSIDHKLPKPPPLKPVRRVYVKGPLPGGKK